MAVGDVYQLTIVGNISGQICNNVLHFRETSADDSGFASSALVFGWQLNCAADYLTPLSNDFTIVGYYARRVHPTPGVPFSFIPSSNNVGGEDGTVGATTAAAIITLYSGLHSRSGRGRIYMPGIPETLTQDGLLTAPGFAMVETFALTMQTAFNGAIPGGSPTAGAYEGTVWSRKLAQDNLVTHTVTHSNLATIRGRRAVAGVPPS